MIGLHKHGPVLLFNVDIHAAGTYLDAGGHIQQRDDLCCREERCEESKGAKPPDAEPDCKRASSEHTASVDGDAKPREHDDFQRAREQLNGSKGSAQDKVPAVGRKRRFGQQQPLRWN